MTFHHGLKFQRLQPRYRDFSTTLNYGLEFPWPKQKLTDFSMNFHHGPSGTSIAKTKTHWLFHDQALKFLWLKQQYHTFPRFLNMVRNSPWRKPKVWILTVALNLTLHNLCKTSKFPDFSRLRTILFKRLVPYSLFQHKATNLFEFLCPKTVQNPKYLRKFVCRCQDWVKEPVGGCS